MRPMRGEQYVQLAPGVADILALHLGMSPESIRELALDLSSWPDDVAAIPRRGRDGRLIEGDPLLLAISQEGLYLAARPNRAILIRWNQVRGVRILRRVARPRTTN